MIGLELGLSAVLGLGLVCTGGLVQGRARARVG